MRIILWLLMMCLSFLVISQETLIQPMAINKSSSRHASLFFQNHSLLFFYSSHCSYCQTEAPLVKAWADYHLAPIEAYAFDSETLPDFPSPKVMPQGLVETAFQGNPIRYPALFILNRETKALYPVSIGALDADELDSRLRALLIKIKRYERKSS